MQIHVPPICASWTPRNRVSSTLAPLLDLGACRDLMATTRNAGREESGTGPQKPAARMLTGYKLERVPDRLLDLDSMMKKTPFGCSTRATHIGNMLQVAFL